MAESLRCSKENKNEAASDRLSGKVVSGDLIWVKTYESSWWPAQIVDENNVGDSKKPTNKSAGDVLVRLYGSYEYMYLNPIACNLEFEKVLKQHDGSYTEIFENALEQTKSSKRKRPKKNGKEKTAKLKDDGLPKKHKPNCPIPVRASPRKRLAASETKPMENNGKVVSQKAEGTKGKTRDQDGVPKKLEPNTTLNKMPKQEKGTTSVETMQQLSPRRMKVMQTLGLIAPSGSPFDRNDICPKFPCL